MAAPELMQAAESEIVQLLLPEVARFLASEVDSEAIDRSGEIPASVRQGAARLGLFGMTIPASHGGAGLSLGATGRVVAEIARVDRSVAIMIGLHAGLGTRGLVEYGTPALRSRWLPRLASGECIASFAAAYPGLTVQSLLGPQYQNPFQIPALVTILNKLIMGTGGTPAIPMLLGVGNADGTGDGIMIAGDVEALAHEYCQRGVPVTFDEYYGLQHTPAAVPFEAHALTFLEALFAGSPAPNGCSSIGTGNSLAPLPQP